MLEWWRGGNGLDHPWTRVQGIGIPLLVGLVLIYDVLEFCKYMVCSFSHVFRDPWTHNVARYAYKFSDYRFIGHVSCLFYTVILI